MTARYATPRDLTRPTYGPKVDLCATRLGYTPLPWQHEAAAVTGEVLPNGRMAYDIVIAVVPRRAGKTQLLLPTFMQRLSIGPRRRGFYTAQRRQDAAEKFRDDWVPIISDSAYSEQVKMRVGNGQESMTLANGSKFGLFAPTAAGVHGKDTDIAAIDEAWAFDAATGADIEAGVRPAMLTRPQRQLWIVSAGGTAESEYLLDYIELGRAAIRAGTNTGVAYFEYSADPTVDDLDDPAVWARVHPAVGHTADLDTLRADRASMGTDLFNRSYLSIFTGAAGDRLYPAIAWRESITDLTIERPAPAFLTYDVAADGSAASIGTAQLVGNTLLFELVDHRPGIAWLGPALRDLHARYRCPLIARSTGPVAAVTAQLHATGITTDTIGGTAFAAACSAYLGALLPDNSVDDAARVRLGHRDQKPLDDAARNARARWLDDGSHVVSLRKSLGDVSPIICAILATDRARLHRETRPRIVIRAA